MPVTCREIAYSPTVIMKDRIVPTKYRVLIITVLFLFPLLHVATRFDSATGFTSLILFGSAFDSRVMDEVRQVPHPLIGQDGYDGQFYAQIAINPGLRNPQLKAALDNPRYRSVRIFLPAVAHGLGLGRPAWILNAYALANLLFYALLLLGFVRFLKPRTVGNFLCIMAAAWTTGVLVSVERALTDLPAAALAFFAAGMAGAGAFPVFAAAVLCRESAILSVFSVIWPRTVEKKELLRMALGACVVALPIAAWIYYVERIFHGYGTITPNSMGVPFVALAEYLRTATAALLSKPDPLTLSNLLSTLSLLVQIAYLFARPGIRSSFWRMGIGFAVLFFFFGGPMFSEQIAYCRAVLPLTLAFNALLMERDEKCFFPWFVAGNAGLAGGALQMAWLIMKP
jgi:hypothetical protein